MGNNRWNDKSLKFKNKHLFSLTCLMFVYIVCKHSSNSLHSISLRLLENVFLNFVSEDNHFRVS